MGGGGSPGKLNRIATIEPLREKEKGVKAMGPQEDINKPEPEVRFSLLSSTSSPSGIQ
jgi:hypothetical protein